MDGISTGGVFDPAPRLEKVSQDGWGFIAQAIAASPIQPVSLFHLGSFGFETPAFVREAAKRALDRPDCSQYSLSNGRKSLRDALVKQYSPLLGRKLDADKEICVTAGAIEGILSSITAFVHRDDEVLMFEPFYDQFPNNVSMLGGKFKLIPLALRECSDEKSPSAGDWLVDMASLDRARSPRTKMIILNSPSNPTGKVFSHSELQAIGNFCVKHNIIILSDEVYEHLSYVPFTRMASLSPEIARITLTVGSAGKTFFYTGWRVGWVLGPERLVKHVTRAHTAICFSVVSPFQEAVAEAIGDDRFQPFVKQSNADMKRRMEKFNKIWCELGLKFYEPQGGYFVVVDMSDIRIPEEFAVPEQYSHLPKDCHVAWFLVNAVGIAVIPCSTFTSAEFTGLPKGAVRFSFGKSDKDIEVAMDRLRGLRDYL